MLAILLLMTSTYSRLFVLWFALSPFAASASSVRFIHPNDPSLEFSRGWTISPSRASTTQPGASFNVVLPRATRVVLLGSSSSLGGELAVSLDCRGHVIHRSKIFSANASASNSDNISTVLFNLNVDPHTNHVLTVTNVLDPRLDATGDFSLDALVVAMQQFTRFVGSNALPWDLSSLFMNVDSLLEELGRINGILLDPSSGNSAPLEVPAALPQPFSWAPSNSGSAILPITPATPEPTMSPVHFGTTVSTPMTSSSSQSSFSSTSRSSTSLVQRSSGSPSDTSSLSGASPSFSPSLRNAPTRASTVAVFVVTSLFGIFSLTLGGIALWMTRARRSKLAATSNGEEQANIDNIDQSGPTTTPTTAREDWLRGGRPLSDGSPYSDLHSLRPSEAEVRRTHRSVVASFARFEAPPSTRELERGRIDASPPLSAQSLGSSLSSPGTGAEINNVVRRAGMGG